MATNSHLESSVRQQGAAAVIDLTGEINAQGDDVLNAAYDQAAKLSSKTVVLNFKGVDYINSTGIALIVGLLAKARKSNRQLLVTGLSEHYQEIFKITRLSDFIKMIPDETAIPNDK
ncbi:MAG TPA: STAS domain-containing protein [Anaerolineae bacterium]